MRVSSKDRREQLIEAALTVARRDGIGAVSTRSVAHEAGATPGIVHYVFASMNELLRAMINRMAELYTEAVRDLDLAEPYDLASVLSSTADTIVDGFEVDPEGHLTTFEVVSHALRNPAFVDLAHWQYATYRAAARRLLERVAELCGVRWTVDVDILASMLVAHNDGVALQWLIDRDTGKARRLYDVLVQELIPLAEPDPEAASTGSRAVTPDVTRSDP